MSIEGVKEALHQSPFRPFRIRMTSGKEYTVEHLDFVSATKSYRRLYVSTTEDDRVEVIDTLLIESIEQAGAAPANR